MNMLLAALIFILLLAVAVAHFIWSFGGTWPIRDRDLLARTVVGRPGAAMPPRIASFLVALLVLAAGTGALALADPLAGGLLLDLFGVLVGLIFLARGIAGYTPRWREAFPEEPFATLDRRNYSPLCLFVGAGFLVLVVLRLL